MAPVTAKAPAAAKAPATAVTLATALALALVLAPDSPALAQAGGPAPATLPEAAEPVPNEAPEAPSFPEDAGPPRPGQPVSDDTRTIVTRAEIAASKVVKIQDALNLAPGVAASSSSVAIHGSSKVLVFLDGTPLNDPTSSWGGINLDHISLSQVDYIEVIKDAGGLHYGQDATGGVVVIHTLKSAESSAVTGQARVWAGNHNVRHADADLLAPVGSWSLAFKAGWDLTDGYKLNNDSERMRGGVQAAREFANGATFSAAVDWLQEEMGLSGLPSFPTPHARMLTTNVAGTAAVKYRGLSNTFFFNRGDVRNTDTSRDLNQRLTVTEYGDAVFWETPLGPGDLALGAGYEGSQARSSEFESKSESTVHLLVAQSARLPFAPVTLRAGVRFNINSAFKNSWNPEFSASFRHGILEAVYKFSRGVNLPSFQQRYNRSSSSAPNPSLGLEVAVNHSLAVTVTPREDLSLNATAFWNNLKGRINYVRPLNSGVGRYENLGSTVYRGADLGFAWKPVPELELKASYTYLDARDLDIGKFLTSQSRDSITAEIVAKPFETFTAAVKADYKSSIFVDRGNTQKMSSRTLWSVRAEKSFGDLTVFLDADNVFDKEYYYVDGLLAPPRFYFMGVKYSF
ncbi:MAG: TonB-dependent receptor [Deltaproteobacteria bacterium]|jgi:iron complex outermembrane receptor protein|nr:TonB-dependent receptor [Deltaproteobacteria bacterium]